MQFEFKTPKDETLKIMSDVASGKLENSNFEEKCEEKITEFAKSEQFETYKKLFTELGLA